ncbi:MAG: Ig-like domain-containing protein [Patescibacteria group bacterium]
MDLYKPQNMKIKTFLVGIVVLLAFLMPTQTVAATSDKNLRGFDTVAGFETVLKAEHLPRGQTVTFRMSRPDGVSEMFSIAADSFGVATATIPDSKTQQAGVYEVSLLGASGSSSFQVFPGEMSTEVSQISSNKNSVFANGLDQVLVTVKLADEFGNPLESHEVTLASSRQNDVMTSQSDQTDINGRMNFLVSSVQTGPAIFTATDETTGDNVEAKLSLVFVHSGTDFKAVGGDPKTVLLAQASSSPVRFEIENLPASAVTNETMSFRVKAVDAAGNTVTSYAGTILFTSTDPNALLPVAYTFIPSDQGRKTFDLSVSFKTEGTQKLIVQEQGNALIKGEKNIQILTSQVPSNSSIRITKPATGTYSVNTLKIEGESAPGSRIKIFDKGQQIGEVQSNASGRFSFTTSLLADGEHIFHAEGTSGASAKVTVMIDSTPAEVEQVEITTQSLAPGETTQVVIRSDADLNSVQATIGDLVVDLEPDTQNPGTYRGFITAPNEKGTYTINVVITDKLGNISPAVEVGKITVGSASQVTATSFEVPSLVTGVIATPGNGQVNLLWHPAHASSGMAFYRIYYGTDPGDLNLVANTKDAHTTWYIPNLQNGTAYYFQIAGVDTQGNEGDNRSGVVSSQPLSTLINSVVGAVPPPPPAQTGTPVLCDPSPCPLASPPPVTPQDGPEVLGMIIASLMSTATVRLWRKRRS